MRISKKPFYTYIYFDVRPGHENEAIYVGKGTCKELDGSTHRMLYHWNKRESHQNTLFGRVLRRIALENLVPKMLVDKWFSTEEDAFIREVELIVKYGTRMNSSGSLCNLTLGGEGGTGRKVTTREKRRKIESLAKYFKTEQGVLQNFLTKERWADPEFKERVAKKIRETYTDPLVRKNLSKAIRKGQKKSGAVEKISKASQKRWKDPEYVEKVTKARQATMDTEPERLRKSEASRKMWADPKRRVMIAEKIKLSKSSPVVREMISKKAKAVWADEFRKEFSKKMKEKCSTPESLAKRAEAARAAWARRKTAV